MYGFDYAYEPATEGASFFGAVKELIRNTQEKIRDFMEKVKTKLKRLTNNKDQMAEDSARAVEIVNDAGRKITGMLTSVSDLIDELYSAFERYSDANSKMVAAKRGENHTFIDSNGNSSTSSARHDIRTVDYSKYGGMDKFKAGGNTEAEKDANTAEWQKAKVRLGYKFSEQAKVAEEVTKDLKELTSMGKLSYDATKHGYDELRAIFKANGDVGDSWKKVQVAADWSTGGIKESLNKVISLYKVGVKATNAFGNRLISGNYRDENGDRLEKEDRKANIRADKNRIKIHREDEEQFDITSKRKDLKDAAKIGGVTKYRNKTSSHRYNANDAKWANVPESVSAIFDEDFFDPAYEMLDDFDDDFDLDMYDYDDFEYSHSGSIFDEDFFD